jgi:hypothetical protein
VNLSADSGSTPLEIVATAALLLLPVAPMTQLYNQLSDELAAESIARHALRLAILHESKNPDAYLATAVAQLEGQWQKEVSKAHLSCSINCQLLSLEVEVGSAIAIHTMGIEP